MTAYPARARLVAPIVSAIVPNYNYARFLDERLQSLRNQTFGALEIIVVDDASTDHSREVIERYTDDSRVQTRYFTERSASTYQRWNDGAALASGRYLYFAGADDACEPEFIDRLVDALERHPSAGLAYSRSRVIDGDGRVSASLPSHPRWDGDFATGPEDELPYLLDQRTIPTASAVVIRRDVFDRCGGFDTSFELAADHMLWARVLRASGFVYVAEPLNKFRTHDGTVRARTRETVRMAERYRVYGFVLEQFDVDEPARSRALERLARKWLDVWRADDQPAKMARHRAIYQVARAVDPEVVARLARLAIEKFSGVKVRSPLAVGRYVWRRLLDERYLLRGRRVLWHYSAHYAQARRAFQATARGDVVTHPLSAVAVTTVRPGEAAAVLDLPEAHSVNVARVAAAASRALADATQCRFVPALTEPLQTGDTAAIPEVVNQQIITIQVKDPLGLDGLRELSDPILDQLEQRIYRSCLIVDKVYVYRSLVCRRQPRASWVWHFDNHPREVLKVMVYLTDVDDDAAPFEYVRDRRGSPVYGTPLAPLHHHSRVHDDMIDRHIAAGAERMSVTGPAGTTIVFDDNIVHRGTLARRHHRDVAVFQVRPVTDRLLPRIDPRWTGSFLHHNINRDPADLRPHLRAEAAV